ncbi:hypothetical protein PCANC_14943 [Puccinia coronata f. sp. avenae]|uniref:Uncharacterized protein n=1 Tax=Puccinia coronata f. sp. avenae TaxID=200324 RepID=A0A2N5T2A9_9BASI|nr:hypothetical protein PCANC_14943 [Puccinia coronata f. sp. avenae]
MNSRIIRETSLAVLILCILLGVCSALRCPSCGSSKAKQVDEFQTTCGAAIHCPTHKTQVGRCGLLLQLDDGVYCPDCLKLTTPQERKPVNCAAAPHRGWCDPAMPSCRD